LPQVDPDGGKDERTCNAPKNSSNNEKAYQPIPGLYLFENFVSEYEEAQIVAELDGKSQPHEGQFIPWKGADFNGTHMGKRWGVHCNLRDRVVSAPDSPLPHFIREILLPKLKRLLPMSNCIPNEANAIDYRAKRGHYLAAHVDDRQLSKEVRELLIESMRKHTSLFHPSFFFFFPRTYVSQSPTYPSPGTVS
jgi:hypothetical protein